MVVSTARGASIYEFKSVEIQLALEGAQSALSEIKWDNFLEKLVRLVNGKSPPVGHERDNVSTSCSFNLQQKSMKLFRKWLNYSTSHSSASISVEQRMWRWQGHIRTTSLHSAHTVLIHHEALLKEVRSQ